MTSSASIYRRFYHQSWKRLGGVLAQSCGEVLHHGVKGHNWGWRQRRGEGKKEVFSISCFCTFQTSSWGPVDILTALFHIDTYFSLCLTPCSPPTLISDILLFWHGYLESICVGYCVACHVCADACSMPVLAEARGEHQVSSELFCEFPRAGSSPSAQGCHPSASPNNSLVVTNVN